MFDSLSDRLRKTLGDLTGHGRVSEADVDWFVGALEETLEGAQKLGRSAVGFALKMAKAGAGAALRR